MFENSSHIPHRTFVVDAILDYLYETGLLSLNVMQQMNSVSSPVSKERGLLYVMLPNRFKLYCEALRNVGLSEVNETLRNSCFVLWERTMESR